ncbi:MAG: hypothetical protein Q7T03_10170 [Deltaproteobacteria bacterium]|nr:hypothetical protein [Deltaproteobacteria bacterium]
MAIETPIEKQKTATLLDFDLKVGDDLPWMTELGIPNKVDDEGRIQWQPSNADIVYLEKSYNLRNFLANRNDQVLMKIFHVWEDFENALAGRRSNRAQQGGPITEVTLLTFPIDQVFDLFEVAPQQIQQLAFDRAREVYINAHK